MATTDKIIEDRIKNVIVPRELDRYLTQSAIHLYTTPGKRTQIAAAKMRAICLQAERGGYLDDLLAAIAAKRGY